MSEIDLTDTNVNAVTTPVFETLRDTFAEINEQMGDVPPEAKAYVDAINAKLDALSVAVKILESGITNHLGVMANGEVAQSWLNYFGGLMVGRRVTLTEED
ncbi:hypothetical protein U6G28_09005 [Actinomycetaceae bacterium MB13-C1-2]|nr:hypothetical protein U6G28_09005 [Actinomycetaceae bacterium MB13-C1-2]